MDAARPDPLLPLEASFPNTRRHHSDGSVLPRTNTLSDIAAAAATTDPDTCRICRGEGTPTEPLFYPCKCSGSIKYVHQDCLMEWLSHSQKKHCELCKTPFRFTKLYSHDMPPSLPIHVFVSHMAKYLFRNMLVWLRALLVASVWLGFVPFLMRKAWSFLFWLSDDGLGSGTSALFSANETLGNGTSGVSMAITSSTVCPSSPLFSATTTVTTIGGMIDQVSLDAVPKFFDRWNLSSSDALYLTIGRMLFGSVGLAQRASTGDVGAITGDSAAAVVSTGATNHTQLASLLGEVGFLRDLTRHSWLNQTIISVLEGQIITILVIVCFILIILVRDYVVQQQPEINMRAAFAAAENVQQQVQVLQQQVEDMGRDEAEFLRGNEAEMIRRDAAELVRLEERERELRAETRRLREEAERLEQEARRVLREDDDSEDDEELPLYGGDSEPAFRGRDVEIRRRRPAPRSTSPLEDGPWPIPQLEMPEGEAPSSLEEQAILRGVNPANPALAGESSSVHDFMRIYREAQGDHDRLIKLAREQHLEDKLEYWIRLTRLMVDRQKQTEGDPDASRSVSQHSNRATYASSARASISDIDPPMPSRDSDQSSDWTWPDAENSNLQSSWKGKGRAEDGDKDGDTASISHETSLRPRISTDEPHDADVVNPLADNTWSFSNLPPDPLTASTSASFGGPLTKTNGPSSAQQTDSDEGYPTPPSSTLAETRDASPGVSEPEAADPAFATPGPSAARSHSDSDLVPGTQPDVTDFDFNTVRAQAELPQRRPPGNFFERVTDFMWRDIEAIDPAELANPVPDFLDDDDDEDNEEPFQGADAADAADGGERDREVVEAAAAAGLDPEAIEDAEDLEGIMELLGMRGPLAGLLQNAVFCTFLVSITIFLGIFIPYNVGRISFWAIANPMRPARILFGISKFIQDVALIVLGMLTCLLSFAVHLLGMAVGLSKATDKVVWDTMVIGSLNTSSNAAMRIVDSFMTEVPFISAGDMRSFSALSHEALLLVKSYIVFAVTAVGQAIMFVFGGDYSEKSAETVAIVSNATSYAWQELKELPVVLTDPGSWVINLTIPEATTQVNPELAAWGGMDRFWAVIGGYLALSLIAALYLRRGTPFSSGQTGQEWEASIIDGLNQASGVMKVILIIGIEMLIFPLYCGLLLDVALLPLFENTTMKSRLVFTISYPLTSIFVHWFVGTGYMFHFALFVSMCRKIMRKGVLYFIRDPDDPEFHPVRDVLERNVTTQLRKILFSAFVYGALVVICLGGVVWGLTFAVPHVLPIHYSSNEPVLEFPLDLLFYNFLMPLAVKFFKPSDGLHAMYTWWFRKCARALRITWFLFGERRIDEEGILALREDSPYRALPWWRRVFLELDSDGEVIPRTWRDAFEGGRAKPIFTITQGELRTLSQRKDMLVENQQLVPDGRFVRTPASDQVKIPKGRRVFLDVTDLNLRIDGVLDQPESGDLYASDQYQFVYIPPNFRARVFLFILFIWIFAAVTGVGITIVPLVFGRRMFKLLIPAHIRTNDIYAFSIGVYVLGSAAYAIFHLRDIYAKLKDWVHTGLNAAANHDAVRRVMHVGVRALKVLYAWFVLLVVFPILVASLMELYLLIPLNTLMYSAALSTPSTPALLAPPNSTSSISSGGAPDMQLQHELATPRHTVRVIQAWTIGLLYVKLAARVIVVWYPETRLAAAVRAVLRLGWLEPDVSALTRAFVIPGLALWSLAVAIPLFSARLFVTFQLPATLWAAAASDEGGISPQVATVLVYRLSFPVAMMAFVCGLAAWSVVGVFRSWKVRIRDEAYLIGERLHNFGVATAAAGAGTRGRGPWKTGGARL